MNNRKLGDITNHYRTWLRLNKDSWVLSSSYFSFWAKQIIELLNLESANRICDIGAGNCELAMQIAESINLRQPIKCVEPVSLSSYKNRTQIQYDNSSAEDFLLNCKNKSFDKIIIKQAIHHFNKIPVNLLAENLHRIVESDGSVLILTMPSKIEYPMFQSAKDLFEKLQINTSELEKHFSAAGFKMKKGCRDYPVSISKEDYFKAIRSRFISTLAEFSEADVEMGIKEIAIKHGEPVRYTFSDRLYYLLLYK